MNRYFLASHSPHYSHQSKDLAHLSPERKKYLVMDVVYKMHPNDLLWCLRHPHELLIDIGPGFADHRWKFSVEELLELYPPDPSVADRIDLAQSPLWLFWPHGKQLFVRTAEELARQPPGYGPTPEGPWPAGFVFPSAWPWKEAPKGPFAPPPAAYLEHYKHFALGGDHAVFAPQPLFYNDRMLCAGVIFFLEVPSKDHELLQKGTVIKVPSYAQPIKHAPTGWWVVDQPMLHDYAQRYESGDLTGMQWTIHPQPDTAYTNADSQRLILPVETLLQWEANRAAADSMTQRLRAATAGLMALRSPFSTPVSSLQDPQIALPTVDVRPHCQEDVRHQDTAPTREPEDAPHQGSPQNRLRKTFKKYSNRDYFVKELGDVIDDLRKGRRSRDPKFEEIANSALWSEGMSRTTLRHRLGPEEHNINLDAFMKERPWPRRGEPLPP